eukprot:10379618-Alexandrium_andersonii.AAC.1
MEANPSSSPLNSQTPHPASPLFPSPPTRSSLSHLDPALFTIPRSPFPNPLPFAPLVPPHRASSCKCAAQPASRPVGGLSASGGGGQLRCLTVADLAG